MGYGHQDHAVDPARDVLYRVEQLVNSRDLREARAVMIGGNLETAEKEQALAEVLDSLDARPRGKLRVLADKARPPGVPPRTSAQVLVNPIGEFAKRVYERRAPL